jgi:putative nucleotidyltransferase with HDIG domain
MSELETGLQNRQTAFATHKPGLSDAIVSKAPKTNQIGVFPAVSVQLMRLNDDPETSVEDLNRIVICDQVLGVRIMKLVNSAFYGMPCQIKTIQHAILLLGFRTVKNVAIAASLVKLIRGQQIGRNFRAKSLWVHSVAVATASQMLAQRSNGAFMDEAFLAGLIHDIGIVVEMQNLVPEFIRVIELLDKDRTLTFRQAEESVLGATHEKFGANLVQNWNFPVSLKYAIEFHHHPWDLPEENRQIPSIVHIADILAATIGLGYTRTVELSVIDHGSLRCANLTLADLAAVCKGLPKAMEESQALFDN